MPSFCFLLTRIWSPWRNTPENAIAILVCKQVHKQSIYPDPEHVAGIYEITKEFPYTKFSTRWVWYLVISIIFPTNELCSTCSDCVILNQYDFDQGFSHEQNRPDRNQYIDATGKGCSTNVNFKPLKESEVVDFSQTYDFCSILHYPLGEYPNICTLRLKKREQENCVVNDKSVKIGQRLGLTDTDILEINRKYNCKGEMLISTGIKLALIYL